MFGVPNVLAIVFHYFNDNNYHFVWPLISYLNLNKFILYSHLRGCCFFTSLKINSIINKSVFFLKELIMLVDLYIPSQSY